MGNIHLKPDPEYLIRGYEYLDIYETEKYGSFSIYRNLKDKFAIKIVKHFPYYSEKKGSDSKIQAVQQLAMNIGESPHFFNCEWYNEEGFIRGVFDGGTLAVNRLLGEWTEVEGLNMLNFITNAGLELEKKGLYFPQITPDIIFATPKGPLITHPFLFEGFIHRVADVRTKFQLNFKISCFIFKG